MVRHEVQFVLRFGVFDQFRRLLGQLHAIEQRHGWSEQTCWRASAGRMNNMVIAHDHADRDAYDAQRVAYHDVADPELTAALAELAELMVPGTATETVFEQL
jgi:hypothetical protein